MIIRRYFVRVPKWAQMIYPNAEWHQSGKGVIEPLWTIDDGPHPESTAKWLELLALKNLKAIFFLLGSRCEQYPELVDLILKEGHRIGSHGYDHLDGWRTSTKTYLDDVEKSLRIINTKLFRPPYGRMRPGQYRQIKKRCNIMMWSVMPGDFDANTNIDTLKQRLVSTTKNDIVVFHDNFKCINRMLECVEMI